MHVCMCMCRSTVHVCACVGVCTFGNTRKIPASRFGMNSDLTRTQIWQELRFDENRFGKNADNPKRRSDPNADG